MRTENSKTEQNINKTTKRKKERKKKNRTEFRIPFLVTTTTDSVPHSFPCISFSLES